VLCKSRSLFPPVIVDWFFFYPAFVFRISCPLDANVTLLTFALSLSSPPDMAGTADPSVAVGFLWMWCIAWTQYLM